MKVTSQSRVSASSGDDMTGYLHVDRGFGGDPTASAFTTSSMLKAASTEKGVLESTQPTSSSVLDSVQRQKIIAKEDQSFLQIQDT